MVPCSVVELRQYTLHPHRRSELVELFEREFVESQEAAGIRVLGQFEDLVVPERFVWFRGFRDMPRRREALTVFYEGPVWRAHRDAANATMVDSDDVLLLRPVHPPGGFPRRARVAGSGNRESRVLLRILHRATGANDLVRFCREQVGPVLEGTGAAPIAWLETEHAPNDFPRLPLRARADVVVSISVLPDAEALRRHRALLAADLHWMEEVAPALASRLSGDIEERVLRSTPRSGLW
ncbi:MAG: NIPSNAP family protein [Myxococcaceae bacterium]